MVENFAIKMDLCSEAAKAIAIRFDLEPVEVPVHDGDVNPGTAAAEPQLFDQNRVRIP